MPLTKPKEPESIMKDLNDTRLNALAAFYINLGDLKRQEGRSFSEALAAYNTSLKLGGESAVVYNNLALNTIFRQSGISFCISKFECGLRTRYTD